MSITRRTVLFSALAIGGVGLAEVAAPTTAMAATTYVATGSVHVRSGAGVRHRSLGVLARGQKVVATGKRSGRWVQVRYVGKLGWVSSRYLRVSKPTRRGTVRKVTSSVDGVVTSLPLASSVSMPSGVSTNGRKVALAVRENFPWITTIYGRRAAGDSDHTTGHAVDIMIPKYRENQNLGQAIADHMRANASSLGITYVIWNQHIWSVQRASEGWRAMANRGSDNANHKNHVHVSVR